MNVNLRISLTGNVSMKMSKYEYKYYRVFHNKQTISKNYNSN